MQRHSSEKMEQNLHRRENLKPYTVLSGQYKNDVRNKRHRNPSITSSNYGNTNKNNFTL